MSARTHARLTELFGEAIELPPAARDALLARVRAADPALATELAALLDADRRAASALATGALAERDRGTDSTVRAARDEVATRPERPRGPAALPAIAGYRVLGVLGEGGMGTVYAAEQDAPRRAVAIKVLHATSPAALVRFWQETEIMARLDHPGIAKIFEAGDADGHPFFAMERVDGVTLDAGVAARGRRERLAMFAAICDAVHHAHVKGIFHRDLKPSNVMVRADGRIAVLDFGIARVAAGDGDTRAGELVGTPVYMSPEQARLRPDEVDARSDVYTLGVILYELLADRLPYDVRGKPLTEIARVICEQPPRPLAPRDRALRGDLAAICDRALAKAPAERYPSAAALADDVRRYLDGARVSVRVPGALEQLRRFVRRRPGLAAAIVAGLAAAVAVTGLWLDARAGWRTADAERTRVARALAALEERTNQLVLDQARAALARDPTRALELLRTLTPRGTDPDVAWQLANEARGRGVADAVDHAHTDEVRWVEATAEGAVSAGYDGRVLRWTHAGRTELARSAGRAHVVRPSPDGARFAIGFDGGAARIVDAGGGVIAELGPLAGDVETIAWSGDGAFLAVADDRGTVVAWSAARRWQLGTARGGIEALAWAADAPALVAGADDGVVRWWNVATGTAAEAHAGREVVAVWTGGDRVAAVTEDGRVLRWRVTGGVVAVDDARATGVTAKTAAFAPDGASVVIGGIDGRVVHVGAAGITPLTPHPRQVRAVAADGRWFATASDDGLIQAWDLAGDRHLTLRGHAQRVRQLAFAPDNALLSGDSEGVVRRWRLAAIPATVLQPPAVIARVAAASDRASVVVADVDGELRRWDLATGASRRLGAHPRITALAAHAAFAVTADADGTVAWWGTTPATQPAPAPVRALAISPDGRWVAAATAAGPIALYGGDGRVVATLAGHAGGTDAVAFTPDGALLISGGQDRVVRAWDPARPARASQELGVIDGDTRHVAIARAGAVVVTAGDDGRVRAWSVRGGAIDPASARVLATHPGAVIALATDGADRVVSVGRDRSRSEVDLAGGARRTTVVGSATQPADVGASTLRAVPLPLSAAHDLTVAADGSALVVGDAAAHDFAALQALLAR